MQDIEKSIYEHQNEIIEVIREGMRIPSVKGEAKEDAPYGYDVKAMLEYALNLGKSWGLKTKNVDGRAGWVEIGEGESMVAVLGHLDVVPEGAGWDYEPYGAEIHEGVLFGRGIADDKGPTLGAMYVLKLIKDLQIPLKKRIRVIFGMDEENGASCIKHYIQCGEEIPEAGFTPDAEYPLIFFEKGIVNLKVGKKNIEQKDANIQKIEAGLAGNIVPPTCTITKKNGESVVISGKDAHASTPWLGESAVLNMIPILEEMNPTGEVKSLLKFLSEKMEKEANGKNLGIYYQHGIKLCAFAVPVFQVGHLRPRDVQLLDESVLNARCIWRPVPSDAGMHAASVFIRSASRCVRCGRTHTFQASGGCSAPLFPGLS